MNILAVDTALDACSVGIAQGDPARLVKRSEIVSRGHAERVFGMIDEALAEAGIAIGDIDRFAATVGPGSFTGIRVGIAAVRGFALVTAKPAIGVTTLAAHAETARAEAGSRPILAALPAKGGEVFAQLFDAEGGALSDPDVGPPERFAALALEAGAALAGAGADVVATAVPGLPVIHRQSAPDIAAVLRLAAEAEPAEAPRPLYIKPPDAIPARAAIARR